MRRRPFSWIPTLAVVLFSVLSLVAYRQWLAPLAADLVALDLAAREQEWQARLEEEARRRQHAREEERVRREVAARERWLQDVVPAPLDPTATLERAEAWAEEEGLEVTEAEADPVETGEVLDTAVLRLSLRGDPDAARRWLGRVAEGIPLVEVEELEIELRGGDPREAAGTGPPTVDLQARLRIFGDAAGTGE